MTIVGVDPQANNVTFKDNIGVLFGNDTTALPLTSKKLIKRS